MLDAPQSYPCAVCDRPSVPRVHPGCQDRIKENLDALPSLYRQLAEALVPGRRGGDGRTATRSAPLPCSIEALDLRARGGIEGVLASWAADFYEREGWTLPQYGSVESAVSGYSGILVINLRLLCDEHPAIRELADEVRQVAGQARRVITGEAPPRKVPVACPCGRVLRVTLDTPGERCGCGQQYGHDELFRLPLAERRAA
ncbi:hypothetical protein [Streptomyces coeruleorubidus]|uniref:Uncharacterized protein n=1 Tax=Streptomyces coeruleorubidus TaxID=116188 RepID=A0A5J6HUR8_STRC4|nr:hypothetical protein [Streptomyces coeruleorubidus]QEV23986.1 hypothetical protein CP976_07385 [Streptomyces coeruleorubidus]GGT85590.1 hypothetical protein GCM10010256_52120 [Streptomyces coeruleorubidus]